MSEMDIERPKFQTMSLSCSDKLLSFIESKSEFGKCGDCINSHIQSTYKDCLAVLTDSNLIEYETLYFKVDSVIDYLHDELNTGHWSNVSEDTRRAFTACSFIKAFITLRKDEDLSEEIIKNALKCIDLGLLLGAPILNNSELLLKSASYLTEQINNFAKNSPYIKILKKRRPSSEYRPDFEELKGTVISCVECPSILHFEKEYFLPQIPVKLTDCMGHWPAMTKWLDMSYLLKIAGNRTVPIEIGSHYLDEEWSQKLMPLKDFIKNHFLCKTPSEKLGYLAQHNLFDQVTELRNDINIPEYCCLNRSLNEEYEDPDINAWLGPKGTVSPLHFDPKDNLLTQVFGVKQVILFSPDDSEYLYPHEDRLLNNTAQVNPIKPDVDKHPSFHKAKPLKCLLKPGEMLYIPPKWWHHITALDMSFSVSFWWQ